MNDNLLDLIASQNAKDEAIARVGFNADPKWLTACYNIIVYISRTQNTFTTDDIWQQLDDTKTPPCHEPRAMGAVLRKACKDLLIAPTDRYVPSARVACHARPIRVWRRVDTSLRLFANSA